MRRSAGRRLVERFSGRRLLLLLFLSLALLTATIHAQDAQGSAADEFSETPLGGVVGAEDGAAGRVALTDEEIGKLRSSESTYQFESEISRLMNLIINSLYASRDVFCRELISNAQDALDKIRFISLTDSAAVKANPDFNISIIPDRAARTLTFVDSGIGMTKEELQKNLGTIAKSGTSEFLQAVEKDKQALNQIGQFGVGFYASFLVADRVTVVSKSNSDPKQHIWQSDAMSGFTVAEDPRGNTLGRGTAITLHIKEDAKEYLRDKNLKELVARYSDFIQFPIYLLTNRTEEVPIDPPTESKEDEEISIEDDSPKTRTVKRLVWEQLNTQKPIWMRDPKEPLDEEYRSFYKAYTKSDEEPMAYTHFKGEGDVDFRSIIYIPKTLPKDFWQKSMAVIKNVKLFVKRVFITDDLGEFLPRWLQWVRVLVDAEDLPLNVSRETLQKARALKMIQRRVLRKTLDMIASLSEQGVETYQPFIENYNTALKIGLLEDEKNRDRLWKLVRYESSASAFTSLDEYITRMRKGQTSIYFNAGLDEEELKSSPFVERLLARGYEVIYMKDPVDEMVVSSQPSYSGKTFANVAKANLKFGDEDEEAQGEMTRLQEQYEPLTKWMQSALSDVVESVVISNRLTTSPCAITTGAFGWTANAERLFAAQNFQDKADPMVKMMMEAKKIMEINPGHPLISRMLERVGKEDFEMSDDESELKELARVLYEITTLRSGYAIKDSINFANRVERVLLRKSLGVDLDEEAKVEVKPAPEVDDDPFASGPMMPESPPGDAGADPLKDADFQDWSAMKDKIRKSSAASHDEL